MATPSSDIIVVTDRAEEMKSIGARWNSTWNGWGLPATYLNATMVDELELGIPYQRDLIHLPDGTFEDKRLYDYQNEAIEALIDAPRGMLLNLSPGLGKTAVSVVAADQLIINDRIVVVAPASLLKTWEREIKKWRTKGGEIYVFDGKLDFARALESRWIITSWDRAVRHAEVWGDGWPLWIFDESVLMKSRKSKRFKTLAKMRKHLDRVWLLSGSPTTRYSDDLWTQLHMIYPRAFSSYWRFAERYCTVEETPWAKQVTGDRANRNAATDNPDLMLVVNQEDVLDLPEYLYESIDVDLTATQKKHYDTMSRLFIAELSNGTDVVAVNEVTKLQKLQQIASAFDNKSAKAETLADIIETYEPPYLIWTHWKDTAFEVKAALEKIGMGPLLVTGEATAEQKDDAMESFKAGDVNALILSMGVGKFGHTFTNVKTMFYVDKSWNADDYFQSLHRVRRIGLKHSPVVVSLRVPGTVDELVEANLEGKLKSITKLTKADLAKILKGLR